MSVPTKVIGFALATALLSGVAMAQGMNKAIVVGHPLPMLGPCSQGFTSSVANPSPGYPQGQGGVYTCTGAAVPVAYCNVGGYKPQPEVITPPCGQLVCPSVNLPPPQVVNGHLSYTCWAPGRPPQ
jgi:hypothetical protein